MLLTAPVLAAVVFAASQVAATPPPGTGPNGQPAATIVAEPVAVMIAGCDADGDARVTVAELQTCTARGFASIDTTGAGTIGYIGHADWALRYLGDRNALPSPLTVDTNNDDRITLTELQANLTATFMRLDADRDDTLTRAELLTIRSGLREPDRRGRTRATPPVQR